MLEFVPCRFRQRLHVAEFLRLGIPIVFLLFAATTAELKGFGQRTAEGVSQRTPTEKPPAATKRTSVNHTARRTPRPVVASGPVSEESQRFSALGNEMLDQ